MKFRLVAVYIILLILLLSNSVGAVTYYVDKDSIGGPCNNSNSGTTTGSPWCTIGKANSTVTANDTVYIRAGSYTETISPTNSGTAGNLITFRNYGVETVTITGVTDGADLRGKNYIVLDGLNFVTTNATWININNTVGSSNYITIRNCYMRESRGVAGIYAKRTNYLTISNNTMLGICVLAVGGPQDSIRVEESTYFKIVENDIQYAAHAALYVNTPASSPPTYGIIQENTINNPWAHGIIIEGMLYNILVDNNWIENAGEDWADDAAYNYCGSLVDRSGLRWEHSGLRVNAPTNIIRRNTVVNCGNQDLRTWEGPPRYFEGNRIYSNTIYQNYRGLFSNSDGGVLGNYYKNNIVAGSHDYSVYHTSAYTTLLFSHNNFFGGTIGFDGQNNATYWTGNTIVDPLFTAPGSDDFTLQATSPMIDTGTFLTTATNTGPGTTIAVNDARYFCDGFGLVTGDVIRIEDEAETRTITDINYDTNEIIINSSISWDVGSGIALAYVGNLPDVGAEESGESTQLEVCSENVECDDGLWCNGIETCFGNVCIDGLAPDCSDLSSCTVDLCNEATNSCVTVPVDSACDDGLYCNGTEFCAGTYGCDLGAEPCVDDRNSCTDDTCDEGTDSCLYICNATGPSDTCCQSSACSGDANCQSSCTTSADCNDGLYCTGTETCVAGACVAGTTVVCNDSIACTVDVCNNVTHGCDYIETDSSCDDGLYCNGNETCSSASGCVAGTAVDCDDSNSCTADSCSELRSDCEHVCNAYGIGDPCCASAVCLRDSNCAAIATTISRIEALGYRGETMHIYGSSLGEGTTSEFPIISIGDRYLDEVWRYPEVTFSGYHISAVIPYDVEVGTYAVRVCKNNVGTIQCSNSVSLTIQNDELEEAWGSTIEDTDNFRASTGQAWPAVARWYRDGMGVDLEYNNYVFVPYHLKNEHELRIAIRNSSNVWATYRIDKDIKKVESLVVTQAAGTVRVTYTDENGAQNVPVYTLAGGINITEKTNVPAIQHRILPLGDSITVGLQDNSLSERPAFGYRADLQKVARLGTATYDFVGSKKLDPSSDLCTEPDYGAYECWHAGVSGETTTSIAYRFLTEEIYFLTNNPSDAQWILLHAGTNDLQSCCYWTSATECTTGNAECPVCENGQVGYCPGVRENAIDRIREIVMAAYNYNSGIKVVISKPVPAWSDTTAHSVTYPNAYLARDYHYALFAQDITDLYVELRAAGYDNVYLVNQYSSMTNTGMHTDNIHPNYLGYDIMAGNFFTQVMDGSYYENECDNPRVFCIDNYEPPGSSEGSVTYGGAVWQANAVGNCAAYGCIHPGHALCYDEYQNRSNGCGAMYMWLQNPTNPANYALFTFNGIDVGQQITGKMYLRWAYTSGLSNLSAMKVTVNDGVSTSKIFTINPLSNPGYGWLELPSDGAGGLWTIDNSATIRVEQNVYQLLRVITIDAVKFEGFYCAANVDCDDGLWCNGAETCSSGTCLSGTTQCQNDGLFCNGTEYCDEETDRCLTTGYPCEDNNNCTTDNCDDALDTCNFACSVGGAGDDCCTDPICLTDPLCTEVECTQNSECSDANVCTNDICYSGACYNPNNTNACTDSNPCTIGDICSEGACVSGALKDTDADGDPDIACGGHDCNDNDNQVSSFLVEGPFTSITCSDLKDNDCDGSIDAADSGCVVYAPPGRVMILSLD